MKIVVALLQSDNTLSKRATYTLLSLASLLCLFVCFYLYPAGKYKVRRCHCCCCCCRFRYCWRCCCCRRCCCCCCCFYCCCRRKLKIQECPFPPLGDCHYEIHPIFVEGASFANITVLLFFLMAIDNRV